MMSGSCLQNKLKNTVNYQNMWLKAHNFRKHLCNLQFSLILSKHFLRIYCANNLHYSTHSTWLHDYLYSALDFSVTSNLLDQSLALARAIDSSTSLSNLDDFPDFFPFFLNKRSNNDWFPKNYHISNKKTKNSSITFLVNLQLAMTLKMIVWNKGWNQTFLCWWTSTGWIYFWGTKYIVKKTK